MKIVVYAICKNESKFAARWAASMGEADEVYALDTGSTDGTPALLREAGVQVTEETIEPWRFDAARNRSLALVPEDADVCVCTDLDEVFLPGWRKKIEDAWQPGTCRAAYRYVWSFQPDGSEGRVFYLDKIHCRRGYRWTHPVHEVLEWTGEGKEKRVTAEGVQLNHRPDPNKSRAQYLKLLEMAVRESPQDDRNTHYLGREYMFYRRWDDCISTLRRHLALPNAVWADERCASMRYIARAYRAKGDDAEAEKWLWRAAAEAPDLREPCMDLADLYYARRDWEGLCFIAGRALRIRDRPMTYISEGEAWGWKPWDYRALGLYYTGRIPEALDAAREALRLAPENPRLQKNAEIIRAKFEENEP